MRLGFVKHRAQTKTRSRRTCTIHGYSVFRDGTGKRGAGRTENIRRVQAIAIGTSMMLLSFLFTF